ncbi:MAG: MFS transporter, partial [Spirochaetota bacterium]
LAGVPQMIISGGTIISSIFSSRILRKFGTGRVTAVSVAMTAVALLGFGLTPSFWWLLLAAVPLGLGAGAVDAGLNAYVASHYESRHMSWLHSFWGVGALSGPLVLSGFLSYGMSWRYGYLSIAAIQFVLVLLLLNTVPLWEKVRVRKSGSGETEDTSHRPVLSYLGIGGVKAALLTFLIYCGIESSMGLWGGSFLYRVKGVEAASAARWVSVFYASITAGRTITGFITLRISNTTLTRWGGILILAGVLGMVLPLPLSFTLGGFVLVGLGCAPIFPCMLHETPVRFGRQHSQAVMGLQMGSAYIGATFLPPFFGFISSCTSMALFPIFLLGYSALLIAGSETVRRVTVN